ncbi:PREDICTED: uncharacterized protein LOC108362523 [Rhagoletis zephyria]|uniref:uncharacterized protein LOC108362523 n=1 Tax=Rhagoletis zephyria TaxID=28612 RepID=UPI00081193C9|nr:PREDICTED: uncharacterized protein LOC108362523 [Rhagoletis zephyria]
MFTLKLRVSSNKTIALLFLLKVMLLIAQHQPVAAASSAVESATENDISRRIADIFHLSESNWPTERVLQEKFNEIAQHSIADEKITNATAVKLESRFNLLDTLAYCGEGYVYVLRRCRKLV